MKKRVLFYSALCLWVAAAQAQIETLPAHPEPGKCYVRNITPEVYEAREERILVRPAYKIFEKVPAEYRTVEDRIVVRPAFQQLTIVQAEFRTVTKQIEIKPAATEMIPTLPQFVEELDSIQARPATGSWEYQTSPEGCLSEDPRDCMVLRYVEHPAVFNTFKKTKIERESSYVEKPGIGKFQTISVQELVKDAYAKTVEVPAEYSTITRQELVRDETVREVEVPAEYRSEIVQILKSKGGEIIWEEIDCALTEFNSIPILFALNSSQLSPEARNTIDNSLLQLLQNRPNIRVEVDAHTDSRGDAAGNLKLSQTRADAVVDYLVSRGIQRSRLVAKGYGETRLKNHCADGVYCTEAEHAVNRRIEFRVLGN